MRLIENPTDLLCAELRRCAFVPTMGALHEGHASLVRSAAATGRPVVVSIFVNPTQFSPNEDYGRYPRTLEADCALLKPLGTAAVFVPSVEAIYPQGLECAAMDAAKFPLPPVATEPKLEDACRPGHFGGVALVVDRLFELLAPATAHFGEKDFQQLRLIEEMTAANPVRAAMVEIKRGATIREADGLAMSSRNRYLTLVARDAALALSRALEAAMRAQSVAIGEALMREILHENGLVCEYAVIRDARTLMPVHDFALPCRALIAAQIGSTRLIDNCLITQRG
jgi:pantoate--beta-alanine ligase